MKTFFPSAQVSRSTLGDAWPLTIESGVLQLRNGDRVVLIANGKTYAVNGLAKAEKHIFLDRPRYTPIDEIWADDPATGHKKSIGKLIEMGLSLKY